MNDKFKNDNLKYELIRNTDLVCADCLYKYDDTNMPCSVSKCEMYEVKLSTVIDGENFIRYLLFYYYVIGHGSFQWWVFPFQLCSIPMYLCVAANLTRREAVRRAIYTFLCTYNLLGGFLALLEPSGLCHEYWTLTIHAFVWHTLLVFLGAFLICTGNGPKSFVDFWRATVLFLILCAAAFCINLVKNMCRNTKEM